MPRTAAALLAGAGLALAGAVVQMAVQNRLVEPGLTGTPNPRWRVCWR
ncbi:iron chelate uptake ABC transporter family permease subunit [Paracoccus aerius]